MRNDQCAFEIMKRKLLIIIVILVVLALVVGVYSLLYSRKNPGLILYGNVDVRQVDISFRVQGQVEALYFEEGDCVTAGQLMAQLNNTPFISQVKQAQANIDALKATLENTEKLVKRRQELIKVAAVSQEDLDTALSNQASQIANLASSEAQLVVSQDNLAFTKAWAPTNGVILTRIREPGSVVNPAEPIYVLSVSSPVWIRAYVSEPDLGRICFGMPAEIYTDTKEGPTYTGKIGFISPVAEFTPKTVQTTQLRTELVYRLRIYVENPDFRLKQGMPVTVKLNVGQKVE